MRRVLLGGVAASAMLAVAASGLTARAEDKPLQERRTTASQANAAHAQTVAYNWTGFYAGVNTGAATGSYDPTTSTVTSPSYLFNPVDVAAVNAAGRQSIKPLGFLGGIQAGFNWQSGLVVFGIEGDVDYLHMRGATTSGAVRYPGGGSGFFSGPFRLNQFVVYSYANADWLVTIRPRVGWALDNWLFYVTGGLALTRLEGQFLFTDGNPAADLVGAAQEASVRSVRVGSTIGGGVETAVTDRLRLKLEYSLVDFGTVQAHENSSNLACCFAPPAAQSFTQSMKLRMNLLRLGLNYSFAAAEPLASAGAKPWVAFEPPKWLTRQAIAQNTDWEFDVGTRLWLSTGTVGAPAPILGFPPEPSHINSRLTYENVSAWTGETFARIDHSSGAFVKGFVGAGGITKGTLVDEDFPGGTVYSNTTTPLKGSLAYANVDVGLTLLKTPGAKVGAFVGYNYFTQHIDGFGCNQVAGDTTCVGADPNFQVFAEQERYDSLRLGLSAEFKLTDRLKFMTDFAYLPWVKFEGQDDHNYRELLIFESSKRGDGMMLEAILNYAVTPNWNVGVGGRYWAWNMHNGTVVFSHFGAAPEPPQLGRYNTERYGVFVQSDYHWGDAARATDSYAKAVTATPPMNWTGIYAGAHVGGGWSSDRWSDPFPSNVNGGLLNVAGFGDTIHGTGPLGGAQAGLNWQTGSWVLGIQGAWSKTDLRGENTCFSGIGGVNCQLVVKDIATVAGRAGYAWDRALVYAKGGGAHAAIDYIVLAETFNRSRGYGVTPVSAWGWTVGGGLEYALTDHWTTMFEYEHIDLGTLDVPFPTVALAKLDSNTIRQSIDTFKLGVNYKFDWRGAVAHH